MPDAGQARWSCVLCNKAFASRGAMRQHDKAKHRMPDVQIAVEPPEFKCDLCDATFPEARRLEQHKQAKHKGPFMCYFCSTPHRLLTIASVQSHMAVLGSA